MLPVIDRLLLLRHENIERRGDFNHLINQARSEVNHARDSDPSRLAEALISQAQLLSRLGMYKEARMAAEEALELDGITSIAAEALITIGISASETEDLDAAEDAFLKAADQCRIIGYRAGLARALHNLAAGVLVTRGKFNLALSYMEEAHLLRSELKMNDWGWPWLRAYIYLIVGKRRSARQALDELVNGIEPATRIAAGYYFLWARLAVEESEFEKAHEYLRLGLRIATQIGVPDLNLWIRIEHSRYYRKTGSIPAAREWAEDAVQLAHRSGMHYFAALALVELAQSCWEGKEPLAALDNMDKAQEIFHRYNASYDLAYSDYLSALWKKNLNDPQAETAWVKAVESITRGGYAFILEKEQENAFPLIAAHLRSGDPHTRTASDRILEHLAQVPPPPLRIVTLGQFAVWKGRALIPDRLWQKRKAGELFRYLLLQPNRTSGKEAILEALWPDRSSDSGNDLLHQSTSTLRRILEPDLPEKFRSRYLSFEGEQISLLLPPGSMIDFEVFRQNLPAALQNNSPEPLQDALSLYTGEMFPADQYAEWCQNQREILSELYQKGLLALARHHYAKLQYADALDCCRQINVLDPWNEESVMLAMQCYRDLGTAPHAMRLYFRLEAVLKQDLGLEPNPELRQLAESIHNR